MASWESKSKKKKGTHHGIDLEDVTEMVLRRFMILGNVGKVSEIVSILTGPVDIADFVLADGLLSGGNDRREIQIGGTKNKKKKIQSWCFKCNGARGIDHRCVWSWENGHRSEATHSIYVVHIS